VVVECGKVAVVVAHGAPQHARVRRWDEACHGGVAQRGMLSLALRMHLQQPASCWCADNSQSQWYKTNTCSILIVCKYFALPCPSYTYVQRPSQGATACKRCEHLSASFPGHRAGAQRKRLSNAFASGLAAKAAKMALP